MRARGRIQLAQPGMVPRVNAVGEQDFSFPRRERVAVADQAYTVLQGWVTVALTTLTGARTITLPLSASLEAETEILVQDEAGAAGSHTITVAVAAGSNDLINGSGTATISANYGFVRLRTNAAGGWFTT